MSDPSYEEIIRAYVESMAGTSYKPPSEYSVEMSGKLDEVQLRRLYRIGATDLMACPRAQQHRILGDESSPLHYRVALGSLVHLDAENFINGTSKSYDDVMTGNVLEEAYPIRENLRRWLGGFGDELDGAEAEVKYEMELRDGFTFVRKIDILAPNFIIDLKTGTAPRYGPYKSTKLEMAMSHEVVLRAGEGDRNLLVVYLGGEEPVDKPIMGLDELKAEAYRKIEEVIEARKLIEAGHILYTRPSNLCAYCHYRGVCSGI